MKLFAPFLSCVSAGAITIDTHNQSIENFDDYFNPGTQRQMNMMRDAILRNQLPESYMDGLDELCNPCRPQATLDEIMKLLPLPDLSAGDELAEKKLEIFVGITCGAVTCRDRVMDCSTRAKEGVCQSSFDWAQQYCPQTCGCTPKTCKDDLVPGLAPEQVSAYLESEEDAEHSSEMDLPMHEAIKYLDPSTILAQFDTNVQETLRSQMCFVPDANTRLIAANELLKVLAADKDAKILNALSPKLPMYLEAIPTSMKNVVANDVICGGYKRSATAEACLGQRITLDTRYCRAKLPRYTYNKDTGYCEKIDYDGCYKTQNRFLTETSCEETCGDYKSALMQVHQQKLEKFMSSLTPANLRDSMLLMFGKTTSDETTSELISMACGAKSGNIREEFRELLCDRLYSVLNQTKGTKQIVSQNPVAFEEEVCTASLAERESCVIKPKRGFKTACEEAGCCWDPQPQTKYAKWKHYCYKTTTVQTKAIVPVKQVVVSDSEHSSCNVGLAKRSFCVARDVQAKSIIDMQTSCEASGCCFEEKPNGGVYYKWRMSCFNPN